MIKSMTGYGRGESLSRNTRYVVEIKSVNHRYFEFSSRLPRGCSFLDEKLKTFFSSGGVNRGKVEAFVSIEGDNASAIKVSLNNEVADSYISALKKLKSKFKLPGKITVSDVASNNDIFISERPKINEEEIWENVSKAAEIALESFKNMRSVEGEKLYNDVNSRCDLIAEYVETIEKSSPETVKAYRERLVQKMQEVLNDTNIDEQRILTEAAIFSDKIAVDEETVRLKSHISQVKNLISSDSAVGRKLDFVVQEMNREANTIGSKAQDINILHTVVEIKSEIEKIREQIQNIE